MRPFVTGHVKASTRAASRRGRVGLLRAALVPVLLLACGAPDARAPDAPIRVSVLPDVREQSMRGVYDPLLAYLSSATGLVFEFHRSEDYANPSTRAA